MMVPKDLRITIMMIPESRKLDGFVSYRTDLFDRVTIQKLVEEFLDLLITPSERGLGSGSFLLVSRALVTLARFASKL
jgi:hypothetical protein